MRLAIGGGIGLLVLLACAKQRPGVVILDFPCQNQGDIGPRPLAIYSHFAEPLGVGADAQSLGRLTVSVVDSANPTTRLASWVVNLTGLGTRSGTQVVLSPYDSVPPVARSSVLPGDYSIRVRVFGHGQRVGTITVRAGVHEQLVFMTTRTPASSCASA